MRVSVVTPSYNQGQFLQRTLDSVASQRIAAAQVGAEIDHVVFDGGSTDSTLAVLENFGDAIKWTSEKDNGQTDAVNKGIRATDGEIIGWLNSDDIYYPGTIARVVAFFEAHPEVDVVYGMADHIDLVDHAFEAYPTEPWDFERLRDTCFICQPAAFFRRRVVETYGLLDERLNYCMDYEYWLRLAKSGARFAYLQEKLAGSRLYAENKTLGARLKVHAEINDMQKQLFGVVPDRWIWNYAHAVIDEQVDRKAHPRWFAIRMLTIMLISAVRWNGRISRPMAEGLYGLSRGALKRR